MHTLADRKVCSENGASSYFMIQLKITTVLLTIKACPKESIKKYSGSKFAAYIETVNRTLRCYRLTVFSHLTSNEAQKEGKAQRKKSCARSPAILLCNGTLPLERVQAPGGFSPTGHTSSFWYAVTAINWVSGKEWLVIIRCGPPTLTM